MLFVSGKKVWIMSVNAQCFQKGVRVGKRKPAESNEIDEKWFRITLPVNCQKDSSCLPNTPRKSAISPR